MYHLLGRAGRLGAEGCQSLEPRDAGHSQNWHASACDPSLAPLLLFCSLAGVKKVAILDFDVHHGNGTGEPTC